jgi:hypothetical protein
MKKDFIIPLAIGSKSTTRPSSLGNTGPCGPDGIVARGQAPVAHTLLGRPTALVPGHALGGALVMASAQRVWHNKRRDATDECSLKPSR